MWPCLAGRLERGVKQKTRYPCEVTFPPASFEGLSHCFSTVQGDVSSCRKPHTLPPGSFLRGQKHRSKPCQDLPRGHKHLRKVLKLRTAGETREEKIIFYDGLWCSTEHFFINFTSYLAKRAFVFLPNAVGNRTSPTCQPHYPANFRRYGSKYVHVLSTFCIQSAC